MVLDNCHRLRPEQVLPNRDEQAAICDALRQRAAARASELLEVEHQVENLLDQIARTKSPKMRDRYESRVAELEAKLVELEQQKAETDAELRKAETGLRSFTKWKQDLAALREALSEDDPDLRIRLAAHLRELIDRIEVFAVGHQKRYDPDDQWKALETLPKKDRRKARAEYRRSVENLAEELEDAIAECNPDWTPDKTFYDFCEYVTERRMSREGRFFRVHFKTGAVVDLVPDGSLASGVELVKDRRRKAGWRFVRPDIDRLWREYKAGLTAEERR